MNHLPSITCLLAALITAGCSGLSFPSLPSFSLLEEEDGSGSKLNGGTLSLPSHPDSFRYDDASVRTSVRFARGSSIIEATHLPSLAPIREALVLDPEAHLLIAGFSSRGAAPGADRVLGEQRALALRQAIATPPYSRSFQSRIHTTSFGSDRPPADFSGPSDQVDLILFSSSDALPAATPPEPSL